jgi:hypothetical protein
MKNALTFWGSGLVPTPLGPLLPSQTEMGSATVPVAAFGVPPKASPVLSTVHYLDLLTEARPANLTGQKQTDWTGKLNQKVMQTSFPFNLPATPWLESISRAAQNLTLCQALQSCASLCKTLLPPGGGTPRLVVKPI